MNATSFLRAATRWVALPALVLLAVPAWGGGTIDDAIRAAPGRIEAMGGAGVGLTVDGPRLRSLAPKVGDSILLDAFPLGSERAVTLALSRRAALGAGGSVVVSRLDDRGKRTDRVQAVPDVLLLGGRVAGEPDSKAFLALGSTGLNGFVVSGGRTWIVSSGPRGADLPTVVFDPQRLPEGAIAWAPFTCGAEDLPGYADAVAPADAEGGIAGEGECRAVRVALETDHEFLANLFGGNTEAATEYALTLLAAGSEIYRDQLSTRLEVVYLRLWESEDDPWTGQSTSAQLSQFQQGWSQFMGSVDRDVAHFLSGRSLGGGIAWLSALCTETFGYAVSANLNGSFPYPLQSNVQQNWDVIVTTHELGHNFGSPHTHSYSPPLDGCGNGDCSNAAAGTIMSYCHLCPGGLANIALEFHPANIDTMNAYLLGSAPCVAVGGPLTAASDSALTASTLSVLIDVLGNDFDADCTAPVIAGFDVESALGATITLSPGTGPDGRDELLYESTADVVGPDTFSYTAAFGDSSSTAAAVSVEVVPMLPSVAVSTIGQGLDVSYYALSSPAVLPDFDLLAATATETVPNVNFVSTGGAFAGSGLADNVGAVFTGFVIAPVTSLYTFSLESDDGSRLLIGDTVVVDNDGVHGMVEKFGQVGLEAGLHPIRIEFFEAGGGAGLIARMGSEELSFNVIPSYRLFRGAAVNGADLNGDGLVNGADLGMLLAAWGTSGPGDLDGNGTVDGADLGVMLASWS